MGRHPNDASSPQLASEQQASVQIPPAHAPLRQSSSPAQGAPTSRVAVGGSSSPQARTAIPPCITVMQRTASCLSGPVSHIDELQHGEEQRCTSPCVTQSPEAQSLSSVHDA